MTMIRWMIKLLDTSLTTLQIWKISKKLICYNKLNLVTMRTLMIHTLETWTLLLTSRITCICQLTLEWMNILMVKTTSSTEDTTTIHTQPLQETIWHLEMVCSISLLPMCKTKTKTSKILGRFQTGPTTQVRITPSTFKKTKSLQMPSKLSLKTKSTSITLKLLDKIQSSTWTTDYYNQFIYSNHLFWI